MEDKAIQDHISEQEEIIENLKNKLDECKQRIEDYQKDTDVLQKLYQEGYIDLDGEPIHKESEPHFPNNFNCKNYQQIVNKSFDFVHK